MFERISGLTKGNIEKIEEKAKLLKKLSIFSSSNKHFELELLISGCSNHSLRVTDVSTVWHIRLPGSQSEILTDCKIEKFNSSLVSALGLCPQPLENHTTGELKGYKVEEFLDGTSLIPANLNEHMTAVLHALKTIHDLPAADQFRSEYNIFERIVMMCETLITHGVKDNCFPTNDRYIDLETLIVSMKNLKSLFDNYFSSSPLVPCHNDLSPSNIFIMRKDNKVQIIDWEFSGMNDKLFDLAYLAIGLGINSAAMIQDLLRVYYQSENINTEDVKKILFYIPLIDLKVAIWSLLQVHMGNESRHLKELSGGWGPGYFDQYQQKINLQEYITLMKNMQEHIHQQTSSQTKRI